MQFPEIVRRPDNIIIPAFREKVAEPLIQRYLESHGFVKVEKEENFAKELRIATMHSLWALKGQFHLLGLPTDYTDSHPIFDRRLHQLNGLIEGDNWTVPNENLRGVLRRIMTVPARRELFLTTLNQAYSGSIGSEPVETARRKLTAMLDVVEGKNQESALKGRRQAMILAQTVHIETQGHLPYGFDQWLQTLAQLGGGALPGLGAAIVYSELVRTGEFGRIEIAPFRDEEMIKRLEESADNYDLVCISGATTLNYQEVVELNHRLAQRGLKVLNGGVGVTVAGVPDFFLRQGTSVFLGEFEGAGAEVVRRLLENDTPTVFIRGGETELGQRLVNSGYRVEYLRELPPWVDMRGLSSPEEYYTDLARRLEALEMLKPLVRFGDGFFEPPPVFQPHPGETSRGCPIGCSYCVTGRLQGLHMRAVPIERLEKEWEAVEASVVGLVDQNPTVLGRDRMEKLLRLVQKLGKVLVFQSELDFWGHGTDKSRFFDRNPEAVEDNRRREELLKDTVLAVQVGIEGPVEFKGRLGRKNPQVYKEALANLNRLGIITLGTFIIGAPPELFPEEHREAMKPFTPWEGQTDAEWRDILDEWADWITYQVPTAAPIPFSFSVIPGTPAYEWLKEQGLLKVTLEELLGGRDPMTNFFRSQDPNIVIGMGDIRKTTEGVRERIYKLRPVLKRLGYTKLSFWKWLFMVAFNKMAGATLGPKMG